MLKRSANISLINTNNDYLLPPIKGEMAYLFKQS
jgi:hypothetical protein